MLPMNRVLGYIRTHKIIFIIIAVILTATIVACAVFMMQNDTEPMSNETTPETASESLKTDDSSESTAESTDEPENTPETVTETPQSTNSAPQTPTQTTAPVQQPTQPSADEIASQKQAQCNAIHQNYLPRINSGYHREWLAMTPEQQAQYGNEARYRQTIVDEYNASTASIGCS